MALNFDVTTTLPAIACTEQNVYDTIETINPTTELVEGTGLQVLSNKIALANGVPYWRKFTKAYTDFSTGATSNDIEILSLPAGGVIHAVKLKHSASFTGGIISAYTISVGITGTLAKYLSASNVFAAPSNTAMFISSTVGQENHGTAASIRAAAVSTGANLNAATAGAVNIWIFYSVVT